MRRCCAGAVHPQPQVHERMTNVFTSSCCCLWNWRGVRGWDQLTEGATSRRSASVAAADILGFSAALEQMFGWTQRMGVHLRIWNIREESCHHLSQTHLRAADLSGWMCGEETGNSSSKGRRSGGGAFRCAKIPVLWPRWVPFSHPGSTLTLQAWTVHTAEAKCPRPAGRVQHLCCAVTLPAAGPSPCLRLPGATAECCPVWIWSEPRGPPSVRSSALAMKV